MDLTLLAAAGDHNLAETWSRVGSSCGWDVEDDGLAVLTNSGLPIAFFNGAYLRRPVDVDSADAVVARAVEFFGARGVPWLLWTRVDVDHVLSAACARAGLREVGGPPGMVLPSIPPVGPPLPDGVSIAGATVDDLDALYSVLTQGYELPFEVAERVVGPALLTADGVAVSLASIDGQPVSTALVSVSGRGVGAAVTWAAVMAGRQMGADHATLQSSESGHPVYRRMGFVDVGRYEQWVGPPA
jgi:hypothetical protein